MGVVTPGGASAPRSLSDLGNLSVFLSYSHEDATSASEIHEGLERAGLRVTRDVRELFPGDDWQIEVAPHIARTRVFLPLCSAAFAASEACRWEVATARRLGKLIVPLSLDGVAAPSSIARRIRLAYRSGDIGTDSFAAAFTNALVKGGALAPSPEKFVVAESPFPGLQPFDDDRSGVYFGRERELADALELMSSVIEGPERRFVVVAGDSGIGKSSFVRAGLVPRLRPDGQRWFVLPPFRAGTGPSGLVSVLSEHLDGPREEIERSILEDDPSTNPIGRLLGESDGAAVVVVLDQAEEIFTELPGTTAGATRDRLDPASARLLELLSAAAEAAAPATQVVVVATVRSDFEVQLSEAIVRRSRRTPEASVDGVRAVVQLLPMTDSEIGDIVDEMSRRCQFTLTGVPLRQLLDRVPNSLPLVSFALRTAWQRAAHESGDERVLTVTTTTITDAVESTAESVVRASLETGVGERRLDALLVRSVDLRGRNAAERWVRAPIAPEDRDEATMLGSLAAAGLMVETDDGHFELAHEAIVSAWPRLERLVEGTRELRRNLLQLRERFAEWDARHTVARPTGFARWRGTDLLTGSQLAAAREILDDPRARLDGAERRYIDRSIWRSRRLTLALVAAVAVFASVASLAGVKWVQSLRQTQEAVATAFGETAAAETATNPALAMVLAAQSLEHRDPAPATATAALVGARVAFEGRVLQPYREPILGSDRTISQLALASDVSSLVATSPEHEPSLWNLAGVDPSRVELAAGHDAELTGVVSAVVADGGRTITTVTSEGLVAEWSASTGAFEGSLSTAADVRSLRASSDGTTVVANRRTDLLTWAAGDDGAGAATTLQLGRDGTGATPTIGDVVFSGPDQRIVAAAGSSLWIARTPGTLSEVPVDATIPLGLLAGSTADAVVAAAAADSVLLVDSSGGRVLDRIDLPSDDGDVTALAMSPDGRWLAVGVERSIRMYAIETSPDGTRVRYEGDVATIGGSIATAMVFDATGSMLITAGNDSTIQRWLVRRPSRLEFDAEVTSVEVLGDRWLVGTSVGLTSVEWSGGEEEVAWSAEGAVGSLAVDADSGLIASTGPGETGVVVVRDRDGAVRTSFRAQEGGVSALAVEPGGRTVATAGIDGTVELHRTSDGSLAWRLPARGGEAADVVTAMAFGPDGTPMLIGDGNGRLDVVEVESGSPERSFLHQMVGPVNAVAVSGDGRYLAAASSGLSAWVSDRTTGDSGDLAGHTGQALSVAFSTDGRLVAVGDDTGSVRVWRTSDRSPTWPAIRAHDHRVRDVAFDPDERLLAASGTSVDYWDDPLSVEAACALGVRFITADQALDRVRATSPGDQELRCDIGR